MKPKLVVSHVRNSVEDGPVAESIWSASSESFNEKLWATRLYNPPVIAWLIAVLHGERCSFTD